MNLPPLSAPGGASPFSSQRILPDLVPPPPQSATSQSVIVQQQQQQAAEAAARAAQMVAARLYVKQATANRIAQVKLAKQIPLPGFLDELLAILNQFDQSNFAVLWFSTNFTMFYHEYCLHVVSPDRARPIGFRTFNPLFHHDLTQLDMDQIYANWLETFNNITSITQPNLIEMLKSERSSMHLNLFQKAYEAIWNRDFQIHLESVDLEHILRHLHALFLSAAALPQGNANEPEYMKQLEQIFVSESYTIIRHIIVTFVHMASKDYEMITRSLN